MANISLTAQDIVWLDQILKVELEDFQEAISPTHPRVNDYVWRIIKARTILGLSNEFSGNEGQAILPVTPTLWPKNS